MNEIIAILQEAQNNPWALLFITIWAMGWFIKEKTPCPDQYVPLILPVIGTLFGLFLLSATPEGALFGFLIALMQMGFYDVMKGVKHYGN